MISVVVVWGCRIVWAAAGFTAEAQFVATLPALVKGDCPSASQIRTSTTVQMSTPDTISRSPATPR